jgi:hypothetical protein
MTLQDAYYYSQVCLFFMAAGAALVGYLQLGASNRYELLKMLQDEQVRKARWVLYHEVRKKKLQGSWWDRPDLAELEKAASLTCATFDIVALMAKHGNYRFFSKEWSNSICWTYEVLKGYIIYRAEHNPRSYPHYIKLYEAAKKYDTRKQ